MNEIASAYLERDERKIKLKILSVQQNWKALEKYDAENVYVKYKANKLDIEVKNSEKQYRTAQMKLLSSNLKDNYAKEVLLKEKEQLYLTPLKKVKKEESH